MKKVTLYLILIFGAVSWAAPNPDDYSINLHVTASHWIVMPGTGSGMYQELTGTVDGKKYTFIGEEVLTTHSLSVLAPGDYKAKLVRDIHKNTFQFSQTYELLFPEGKTKTYWVVGQAE